MALLASSILHGCAPSDGGRLEEEIAADRAASAAEGGSELPLIIGAGQAHTVELDRYSLLIDGRRLYLWAGEFHYWRLPSPDLWRDVLEKMKAAGFNAVNIYFHWGFHSPAPGVYDFTGIRDVDRLLDMAAEVGLYVIARPGPYINAETDSGGLPAWLNRLGGQKRSPDPAYLAHVDEWLTQIDAILVRHQLTDGTGTILINQVENEFTDTSDAGRAYMQHLIDKFRQDGIAVPLTGNHWNSFNTGTVGVLDVDGWDAYPQGFNCSTPTRWSEVPDLSWLRAELTDRPLFFPEYQGGAFDPWGGPGYEDCRLLTGPDFERVFYSTNVAVGSTMQSFYMTYGGTSWGYLPYPGVYTSYDYGAAIAESRQLTSKLDQQKLYGYLLAAAAPLTMTDALPVPSQENPAIWVRGRMNPENGAQLYVLRHVVAGSTEVDQTHLSLDLTGRTAYTADDVDPAVVYAGSWTHASGQPWTAGDFRDTESFSPTAGDSASYSFSGTAVRWVSSLDANHGIAAVSIDGAEVARVDTYGSPKQYQSVAFQAFDLADGEHTLTITATGERNPAATGSFVVIDAVDAPPAASGDFYATVPQEPGTAITIDGRDARVLLAGYQFLGQELVYSTSQLLTHATLDGTDVVLLHGPAGQDGETVLRYQSEPAVDVLAGEVAATWDPGRGDLRLNYTHGGLAKVLVSGAGRPDLVLLLAERDVAAAFWRFDTDAGAVLARGPTLVRTANIRHGRLELRGDTSADTTLEVYAPSSVCQVTWNGRTVRTSGRADPVDGPLVAHLAGPEPVTLPALDWRHRFETPEAEPAFDDFHWALADHLVSQNAEAGASTPVLGADEYGFHHGHTWYRGHFTATGSETDLFLNGSTGNSTGQYAVWLNGAYLGVGNGGTTFPVPAATLRPGEDNVVSVLIANMGHDQGNGKIQRGLVSARLFGSPATLTWRVQGALGGEELIDPVRGAMNRGGLHGERAGWHLPGFPDDGWDRVSLPHAGGRPGVAWYRSHFQLDLPRGQDVPIALRFADDPARRYRVQIYLNGWNLGLYVNHVGPQREFVLPAGLLRAAGENTLALAVWSDDASGGLGPVSLVVQGNVRGGVPVADVRSPRFDPRQYVERPAPAHLRLAGPDLLPRGGTAVVTATLELPPDRRPVTGGELTLSVPEGWQIAGDPTVVVGRLRPGASITAEWTVTAAAGDQPASTILVARAELDVRGETRSVSAGKTLAVPPPPPTGDRFVSDLPFQSTNGWGPVERDTSNGEQAAGDGRPISLGGAVHARGLGAHAPGTITVYLGGNCASFTTVVGIDDEAGNAGSVRFRVRVDNREVASTNVVTGASPPVALDADIAGGEWLELVLDEAGDGNGLDHADWADAVIHCR